MHRPPAACCPSAGCCEPLLFSVATVTLRFISFEGPQGGFRGCMYNAWNATPAKLLSRGLEKGGEREERPAFSSGVCEATGVWTPCQKPMTSVKERDENAVAHLCPSSK